MGIAAYNRGTRLICRQADATGRPAIFEIMERLNAIPKDSEAIAPFGPIHFLPYRDAWYAMCPVKERGFFYKTLNAAVKHWRVTIVAYRFGAFIGEPFT